VATLRRRVARIVAPALVAVAVCAVLVGGATLPGVPQPSSMTLRSPQSAAPACAARVVDDWVDDGVVQGTYRLRCYRDAIDSLPEDMRAYSTAPADLQRALLSAIHTSGDTRSTASAADR
jgi:hypothetical protein